MAYYNDNTLKKLDFFAQVLYGVKFFSFVFFFYAFISFVFWFLNCLEVDWLYLFNWLFILPYKLVSTFYRPQGVSADFSLAIIGAISLLLGFVFDFFVNILYQRVVEMQEIAEAKAEKQREEKRKQLKKRTANKTARPIAPIAVNEMDVVHEEVIETSKLLFLIQPNINKIKRKADDIELTFQEVELWKQRVNKKLLENVSYSKPMQKGYYRKNLFLIYKDFNYVDDFIYYIKPTIDSIVLEFRKYGIAVSFNQVLSAISKMEMLEKELDCMDTILSLSFTNEFILTNRFKVTYDNKPTHQYAITFKGEYNLSKNLALTNNQPIYILSGGEEKGEQI